MGKTRKCTAAGHRERLQSTLKSVRLLRNERHSTYRTARNRESVVRLVARLDDMGFMSRRGQEIIFFFLNLSKIIPLYLFT